MARRIRRLAELDVFSGAEFEDRFGPLPRKFPDEIAQVTIDNRNRPFHEWMTVTGKPMMQATREDLMLDLAVNSQVEAQLRREGNFIELLERLMDQKFGNRVTFEAPGGDVWDEAEAAWRAAEGRDPPISRDDEMQMEL